MIAAPRQLSARTHRQRAVAELARAQHGAARTRQLVAIGVSQSTVSRNVRDRIWQRLHHGVVFLGSGPIARSTRLHGAVLAIGDRAFLAGLSAAEHLGLLRIPTKALCVVTDRRSTFRHARIDVWRTVWLPPGHVVNHRGIPTTSATRTIVDVARELDCYDLVGVLDRAYRSRALDLAAIESCRAPLRCRAGSTELVLAIEHYRAGSHGARSYWELVLARAIRAAGMPPPILNVLVDTPRGPFMFDLWWPRYDFALELDDPGHDQASGIAADQLRDLGSLEAGIDLLRVPNDAVSQMLDEVLDRVEERLRRLGWRGTRRA